MDTTGEGSAAGRYTREKADLLHSPSLKPEDIMTFIQLGPFAKGWKRMGLNDLDAKALEMAITTAPQGPPVIPGTGGLRKLRFAPSEWNCGKSGGARVCYAYYPKYNVALLVTAYPKSGKDDLTQEEKKDIHALLKRFGKLLEEGRIKVGKPYGQK